jgi:hypothetical protein
MAAVLRAAGLHVEIHDDHFRQDALDLEWLTAIGKKNWIVVTRDERIRYRVAEKHAIRRAKVRAFVLAAQGDLRADMLAQNFLRAFPKVRRVVEKAEAAVLSQRFHAVATSPSSSSDRLNSYVDQSAPLKARSRIEVTRAASAGRKLSVFGG